MAKAINAQAMVDAFRTGMSAGATKYKNGVNAVTENPAAAAAAKVADGTWAANTVAAAGKLQNALSAVTLQQWQQASSGPGATAFAQSANKAAAGYAKVAPQLAQAAQAAQSAARAVSDPIEKVRAAINAQRAAFGKPPI